MPRVAEKDNSFARLALLDKQTLFLSLDEKTKGFIHSIASNHRLTFQQLMQITEMAVDLRMWNEVLLPERWIELENQITSENGNAGKTIFEQLRQQWHSLKNGETVYDSVTKLSSWDWKKRVTTHERDDTIFGMCPVASEKTICCNLLTIDAIQGCGFGCSYCSIQTFYDEKSISVDANLSDKLQVITLDPSRKYHICSGQSSDSLFLGNSSRVLTTQLDFARRNPNVILEFKTKSKNVSHLLETDVPPNVFVSWSVNPQSITENEEHFSASLKDRLVAARRVADRGILIGFHFHPMVHYRGWENDYETLIRKVLSIFSSEEVALVSFGTLTFIKSAIKNLRLKGLSSKVLQIPLEETAGKLSYPQQIKEELFQTAWHAFAPWHDSVFFYLCMENRELWQSVFGFCHDNNNAFEEALLEQVFNKSSRLARYLN